MQEARWKQRFDNFLSAFGQLEFAVLEAQRRPLSDLEKQGLIQAFEFTHELGWNVLKDYLEFQGISGLVGSRDTAREAFQKGIVSNGEGWMQMIRSRNLTSHTYSKKVANEIVDKILSIYYSCFQELKLRFQNIG